MGGAIEPMVVGGLHRDIIDFRQSHRGVFWFKDRSPPRECVGFGKKRHSFHDLYTPLTKSSLLNDPYTLLTTPHSFNTSTLLFDDSSKQKPLLLLFHNPDLLQQGNPFARLAITNEQWPTSKTPPSGIVSRSPSTSPKPRRPPRPILPLPSLTSHP